MKREHKTTESYVNWLKSLGCVFYAPLTEGDTRDYISGQDMTIIQNVTWNSSNNSYYFQFTNTSQIGSIAEWNGLNMPLDISNTSYGYLCEIKITNWYNQQCGACPLILYGRPSASNTKYTVPQLNVWYKVGYMYPPTIPNVTKYDKWYRDGTMTYQVNRGSTTMTVPQSATTGIWTNNVPSSSFRPYTYAKFYMRNAMVFDRELTLSKIRKIQGYE